MSACHRNKNLWRLTSLFNEAHRQKDLDMKKPILLEMTRRIAAMAALFCLGETAHAGWTGSMNGVGLGCASVNVTSSSLNSNLVKSPTMIFPSASMTNADGFFAGGPLPNGASAATIAQIKGTNGYKWKATTLGSNGDKTDNAKLDSLVKVDPSDCASLDMD